MIRRLQSIAVASAAVFALLVTAVPLSSHAQEATPVPGGGSDQRTITVSGRGTVTITPDSASVVVGVDVTGDTLVQTLEDAAARMTAVLETVEAAGIPADQVQTVNYSINIINDWDDQGRIQGVSGYQVSNQVQIMTTDIDGLGDLIDDLVQSGANTLYSINFFSSDATEALSQARTLAVADANAKAQELAVAADVELGEIISIVEISFSGGPIVRAEAMMADQAGAAGTPIESGSLQVSIDVTITWSISS